MKKFFAFLSMLLLTIALVGVSAVKKPAVAAGKITSDPTLAGDEVPVYIMDSIYTTFPNYYDNAAEPDPKWSAGRMYPWNETRLRVARFDSKTGEATGEYFAVYLPGHTQETNSDGSPLMAAGKSVLLWKKNDSGEVIIAKRDRATMYDSGKNGNAPGPSLSQVRVNVSGEDLEFNLYDVYSNAGHSSEAGAYLRMLVFDGEGRLIRGVGTDDLYSKDAPANENSIKFAPEYCYVNGVVTKIEDGIVCDKVKDEAGEPTAEDNLLYSKFVWEWFEEKPENVNTVPYLSEGWDPEKWDYCEAAKDGGFVCIAFTSASSAEYKLNADQIAAYKKTLTSENGEHLDEAAATTKANAAKRTCLAVIRVPAGGFTYGQGYLEKGVTDYFINETCINGYKFGRTMLTKQTRDGQDATDEDGQPVEIGMGEMRTYNFAAADLTFRDQVIDDASYQMLKGQNVVEVMQGNSFIASKPIQYDSIMSYWQTEDDIMSYASSADGLEFEISVSENGGLPTTVVKRNDYNSQSELAQGFVDDYNAWLVQQWEAAGYTKNNETGVYELIDKDSGAHDAGKDKDPNKLFVQKPEATWSDNQIKELFYNNLNTTDFISTSASSTCFLADDDVWEKWGWIFDYIRVHVDAKDSSRTKNVIVTRSDGTAVAASPGTLRVTLYGFFTERPLFGIAGVANTSIGWDNGEATQWINPKTSLEQWNEYVLDASTKAPNENWVVTYTAKNTNRLDAQKKPVSSSITVKYVVVDSYTPIISYNKNLLTYTPTISGGTAVCDPIDKYSLVTAYDAQYVPGSGLSSTLGSDITQNVEFDTELDFDNPKEGTWPVTATIWNNSHTKSASVKFDVRVRDITAPKVLTRDVTILQGQDFHVLDGIVYAYDNVQGNLLTSEGIWWIEESAPVDTNKLNPGQDFKQKIEFTVFDSEGNEAKYDYQLTIIANKYVENNVTSKLEELEQQLTGVSLAIDDLASTQMDQQDQLDELEAKLNELAGQVDGISTDIATVKDTVGSASGSGCKKSSALLVFSLAGAASVLALVFKKRH